MLLEQMIDFILITWSFANVFCDRKLNKKNSFDRVRIKQRKSKKKNAYYYLNRI